MVATRNSLTRPPRTTLSTIWAILPALMTAMYTWTSAGFPVDLWHRIASGRLMWRTGGLVSHDSFAHTIAGLPIINQNWAAELFLFGVYRLGGMALVQFLTGLCYASAIGLVTLAAFQRCHSTRIAAALGVSSLAVAASNLGIRTQALAVLLFAFELWALSRWPPSRRLVLAVVLVELLWANTHGSFPLGVVLPGCFLVGTVWQQWRADGGWQLTGYSSARVYFLCTAAAFIAMFVNPNSGDTLSYISGVASKASTRGIVEWAATDFVSYSGTAYLVSLVCTVLVLLPQWRRVSPTHWLLLIGFAALAFRAQRMVIWWALVMPVAVAPHLRNLLSGSTQHGSSRESASYLNTAVVLFLFVLLLMCTPWTRALNPLLPSTKRQPPDADQPSAAVNFLSTLGGHWRAYNPMEWGGYLSWELEDTIQVFIDPRIDFFPDDVWNDYLNIGHAAPGWEATLKSRGVDLVIWNLRLGDALPHALQRTHRWTSIYRDDLAAVYVRKGIRTNETR